MNITKSIILNEEEFSPYGRILTVHSNFKPNRIGSHWKSYSTSGRFKDIIKFSICAVEIQNQNAIIHEMERHLNYEELIMSGRSTIYLPVAVSKNINNPQETPKAENVKVFRLCAGEIIILNKGVWHAACYSLTEKSIYFFGVGTSYNSISQPKMIQLDIPLHIIDDGTK